jgi:hypothetical protein
MTDPENVTQLQKADLEEVEVDETDEGDRPQPLEADDADVAEQRIQLDDDDERRDPYTEY